MGHIFFTGSSHNGSRDKDGSQSRMTSDAECIDIGTVMWNLISMNIHENTMHFYSFI